MRFGPFPWKCSICGHENEMAKQFCQNCNADPRTTLSDSTQIYPEHRRLKENGQQEGYVVLADEERAKGFVRPVRRTYVHQKCSTATTMEQTIAETYARNPHFYNGTFCCACGGHFPVGADGEFVWDDGSKVGT